MLIFYLCIISAYYCKFDCIALNNLQNLKSLNFNQDSDTISFSSQISSREKNYMRKKFFWNENFLYEGRNFFFPQKECHCLDFKLVFVALKKNIFMKIFDEQIVNF